MPDDPRRRRPATPGRLWTEPRETDEHQRWLKPTQRIQRRTPAEDAADKAREEAAAREAARAARRRRRRMVAAGAAAVALLIAGALGASLLDGDDGAHQAALPAVPGAAPADERSRTVRSIYAAASPSVVSVRVRSGGSAASGTGFLIDADGTIVTNAHVVSGSEDAQVRLDDGGRDVDAEVVGTDASSDLAVIRVDRDDAAGIRPLALADSERVQVGDLAVAIGYPLGLDRTATAGIVSGVGRQIEAPNGFSIDEVIQTDAPINPGNSGGPLLDAAGRVIGVNSQIATAGGSGSVGIGFAVPSNTVREVVPRLRQGRSIRRAFLGVSTAEVPFGPGAAVAEVVPSGPADAGGLREGDVIRRVGGREVRSPEDVGAAVEALEPGEGVDIEVERGGSRQTLGVTLGTRPERTP